MVSKENIVVIFLVSLGIFRVDLFGSMLGFEFTPTLLVSLFLNLYALNLLYNQGKQSVRNKNYLIIPIILVYFIIRTFPLPDVTLYKKIILFFYVFFTCLNFLYLFNSMRANHVQIIEKFLKYSTLVYFVFSLTQLVLFFMGKFMFDNQNDFVNLYPQSIGYFLPRLNGGFIDPNVCGFFFTILYLFTIIFDVKNGKFYRSVFSVIILLTLSRSAIACFLLLLLGRFLFNKVLDIHTYKFRLKLRSIIYFIFVLFGIAFSIPYIIAIVDFGNVLAGLQARFTDSGSTESHLGLMQYGLWLIFNDWVSLLFGHGLLSGSYFAADFFNGIKQANFHSEYISMLIEVGFVGLLLELILIYYPLFQVLGFRLNKIRFAVILFYFSIALQNVFYQQYLFFYYWTFIFIMYSVVFSSEIVNKRQ